MFASFIFALLLFNSALDAKPRKTRNNSCDGRCDDALDTSKPCQCNTACERFGDCCVDYSTLCKGGESPSPVTDAELSEIANQLYTNDVNRASFTDVMYNLQSQTSTSSTSDIASNPLFSYVNEESLFQQGTFAKFIRLLDNYNRNTGQTEDLSQAELNEIEEFLDVACSTQVMMLAANFLRSKGHIGSEATAFKDELRSLWFDLYPRSSSSGKAVDSSGFEHVFVGETKSTSVTGFHNWVQFYLQERDNVLNYKGFISEVEPLLLNAQIEWYDLHKSQVSFFVRTSPEFDMAVYTICVMTRTGQLCPVSINGQQFAIQTYDVAHKDGLQVATSYPAI